MVRLPVWPVFVSTENVGPRSPGEEEGATALGGGTGLDLSRILNVGMSPSVPTGHFGFQTSTCEAQGSIPAGDYEIAPIKKSADDVGGDSEFDGISAGSREDTPEGSEGRESPSRAVGQRDFSHLLLING